MMMFFVLLLVTLPIAIGGFVKLPFMTWQKFAAMIGTQLVISGVASSCVFYSHVSDTEVWNGRVTSKKSEHVMCSHSYQCNPHSCNCDSKGNCSTCYDTCYEHFYDVDWDVYTSNGERVGIARVDRQGVIEPARFTNTQIGEPTSITHEYVNYVKASPDSVFRHQGLTEKYKGQIPDYPLGVYDYYRLNRLVTRDVNVSASPWNAMLSELNADVGSPRQANVIVVLTQQPDDYFYALQEAWIGGKKNDIVLVVGTDNDLNPKWAEVMAWTIDPIFKIKVRDDTLAAGTLTPEKVGNVLRQDIMTYHKRKPMADFAYLKSAIVPTTTQWVVSIIVSLLIAGGLLWLFNHLEERNPGWSPGRRGHYRYM